MNEDNNLISGIFNYCDRWCERCIYTKRCAVYAQTENIDYSEEGNDLETFFAKLKDILEKTHKILDEKLREIYPEGLPENLVEEYEQKSAEIEKKIDSNQLYLSGKEYSALVRNWFESQKENEKNGDDEINYAYNFDTKKNNERDKELLSELIEIISFYQYFIEIKIKRALFDKYEFGEDDDFKENILTTQKLILLAITRSLAAWEILYDLMNQPDGVLTIMVHLEKLKHNAELTFNEAIKFKRPYFD